MIVLDASAAVELLLALPLSPRVQSELEGVEWQMASPQLLEIEVLQVLRRRVNQGLSTVASAEEARDLLLDLNIRYYDHAPLADRIWELRENLTAYDACYVALAEALDLQLLTCDAALANAPGHNAEILLVNEP